MTSQVIQPKTNTFLEVSIWIERFVDPMSAFLTFVFFWKSIIKLHRYVFIILHNKVSKIAVLQENKDDSYVCVCVNVDITCE